MSGGEVRDGVTLTNLDDPLFDGAGATKRDLVEYLDAVADRILAGLRDRPLTVMRARPGQAPFMQKNVPKYAPPWVRTVTLWAETSKRDVAYALCNDRPTLLWFANQRAVEYHPTLILIRRWDGPTHLVLDLDPPEVDAFPLAVRAAPSLGAVSPSYKMPDPGESRRQATLQEVVDALLGARCSAQLAGRECHGFLVRELLLTVIQQIDCAAAALRRLV